MFPGRKVSKQHLTLDMALRFAGGEPLRLGSSLENGKSPTKEEIEGHKEPGRKHSSQISQNNNYICTHFHFLHMQTLRPRMSVRVETSATPSPKPEAQSLAELGWIPKNCCSQGTVVACKRNIVFCALQCPMKLRFTSRSGHMTQGSRT